ncbi:hypothetical protein JCM3765_001635 [Sporobolomyces pararoseus]
MPNPPPPAPPPPLPVPTANSTAPPPPLTKFPLHTPANASSPLITCSSSTGPLPNQTLLNLRTVLVASRFSASSRVQLKEENKKLLNERQAHEKRTAEEAGRIKENERRRKREEEERREKERLEKLERERLEAKQREEREAAVKKQLAEQEESERKKLAWEKEQAAKLQQQQLQQQQLQAQKSAAQSTQNTTGENGDTNMKDATVQIPLQSASSPEPEEDALQPKPPRNHDKKKKRKREAILDSDDSGTESTPAPEQPLLQKIRKLESSTNSHQPSPSSVSTPATPGPATPSARNSPLPATNGALPPLEPNGLPRMNPIERRLKQERFTKHSIPIKPAAPGSATAFYVPTYSLVPVKPEVIPPTPTAKRQADVEGDFSNAKPGQQIAHSTFINWTESYLRPFGEDDLAFLAAKPEDVAPYIIPPLGKPYQQRWEEEDFDHPPQASSASAAVAQQQARQRQLQQQRLMSQASNPLLPPPLPRLKPCHLSEEAMATENIFLGPLSERLMSALAFEEGAKLGLIGGNEDEESILRGEEDNEEEIDAEGEDENEDGAQASNSTAEKAEMDAVDLEERIKRELRFIGLLPEEEVDWTKREDDEISTALRACQRLLQQQVELNESRKAILMSIVKDRMAYQEYETARDAQERVIEAGWHKRQRTDSKKKKKGSQKDKDRSSNKVPVGAEEDPSKVPISPVLMEAVEKRNALVESFKPFFEEDGGKSRWWGIPETSVYEGMLDSIEEEDEQEQGEVG